MASFQADQGKAEYRMCLDITRDQLHSLARYRRTRLEVRRSRLYWTISRAALGLVPVGSKQVVVDLDQIEELRVLNIGNPVRAVAGLACLAAPWFFMPWWAALPTAMILTWVVTVALGPRLELRTASGGVHRAGVCFSHQLDADLFVEAVKSLSTDPAPASAAR